MWENLITKSGISVSREGFRRYFSNTGWMMGGQIFSLLVSFLIGAWVARSLGPQEYGLFSYSLSFAGVFSLLAGLGVDGIISRDLVRTPERSRELLGSGLAIKIVGGLTAWIIASGVAWLYVPSSLSRLIISLIAFSYVIGAFSIIDVFFRSKVQAKYSVRAQLTALVFSAVLKIFFILSGANLIWLAVIYVLESLVLAIALLKSYRQPSFDVGRWSISWPVAKELLTKSWPLMLSGLSAFMLLKIDQVMLGSYLNEISVGLYAAAVKLSEAWYFIPGIICASLFPAIINARSTDIKLYRRRIKHLYGLLLLLAIAIALPLAYWSDFIVNLLFGPAFLEAAPVAAIYVWSTISWFLAAAFWYKLMAEDRLILLFWSNFIPLIVNILLNYILIPRAGIIGAAWATVISYAVLIIFIIYSLLNEDSASYN